MAARYTESHDDMLGEVRSSLTGATQWDLEAVTGTDTAETGFFIGALDTSGNDFFQAKIQVPHRRKLGSVLDSIHLHYVLQAASSLNDTVIFSGSYCWVNAGGEIPASAGWTAFSGAGLTLNLGAAKNVRYYGIHSIQSAIAAPASEGYGGMILIRIIRSGGTYAGKLGILDCDAHTIIDRKGSVNETAD